MKEINISGRGQYYSQRNNKRYPHSACNTTALTECLDITDQLFDFLKNTQPEDYLMSFLRRNESFERMEKLYPWARKGGYEPNEVHAMLEWAVNTLTEGEVDSFSTKWDLRELLFEVVINGHPSAVSGRFTDYGHIVVLVGIKTYQEDIEEIGNYTDIDLEQIQNIIVDDPYGDYFSGYKDHHGNNILFTLEEFDDLTKTFNDTSAKWGHLIRGVNKSS